MLPWNMAANISPEVWWAKRLRPCGRTPAWRSGIVPRRGTAFLLETDPDAYGFRAQAPEANPAIDALQTAV